MKMEALIEFLQEKGKNRFEKPEETAELLQKLARSSFRLHKTLQAPVNIALSATLSIIQHMESEIKKLDKEIAKLMKGIPETLSSVKGIEPVFVAGIIAEIGDVQRFPNHGALAKYAGLIWNQHQSGEFQAEDRRHLRIGNKYLRYYLVQAADSVRKYDAEYKAFYHTKFDEVTKHQHKRALVLTARKWVRLVHTLLRTK